MLDIKHLRSLRMTSLLLFSKILLFITIIIFASVKSVEQNLNKTINQLSTSIIKSSNNDRRLPKNINPLNYDIRLTPYLDENNFTFEGSVSMILDVLNDTSSVILHANQLNICKISVNLVNTATPIQVSQHTFSQHQKLNIFLKTVVSAGSLLIVNIKYNGLINEEMKGFFRSSYKDDDGNTHWLAATYFQKFSARRAFPCFDEPAFKAKFKISIMRPSHYHTISNMNLKASIPATQSNWTWDHYEESPVMSTYLVAFVVSDYKYTLNLNDKFRLWSHQNTNHYGSHVLKIGQELLNFLEEYTGIRYPAAKMDFVEIPNFPFDSTENWALNILSDELPLFSDTRFVSTCSLMGTDFNILHEVAHMWFGNLVTSETWDYLWLKEGFTAFFEWFIIDILQPQLKWMEFFTGYLMHEALKSDSVIFTMPMNNEMENFIDDVDSFDTITYEKAASIIRMMQHAFGDQILHKTLKYYLKQNQYSTSTPSDLWSAMEIMVQEAGGLPGVGQSVAMLMESWTSQPGYPVVHVSRTCSNLTLVQERFLITGRNESLKELYWIPITIATESNPDFSNTSPTLWMGSKEMVITVPNIKDGWTILNVQQTGFYRVNYDLNSWKNLFRALNQDDFGGIPEVNRAQIIDDLFNLARADYISYDLALTGTQYLIKEKGHLPWKAFFTAISFLYEKFDSQTIAIGLKKYLLELISSVYKEISFEKYVNDTRLDKLHRQFILWWACKLDYPDCVNHSKKLFDDFRTNTDTYISPDAKFTVFCSVLQHGNYNDWEFLWQQYRKSYIQSEKILLLSVLGCSQNKTAIDEYLRHTVSPDGCIGKQDAEIVLSSIYFATEYGVDASLDFFLEYYNDTYNLSDDWDLVQSLLSFMANKISTAAQISKFSLLLQNIQELITHKNDISKESLLSIIEKNKQWYDNHVADIENWIIKKQNISTD